MSYAITLILKFFSVILIGVVGYFITRRNILTDKGKDVISLLLNRVTLPFLIISAYSRIRLTPETMLNTLYIIIAAIVIYIINYTYSTILAKKLNLDIKKWSVFINGAVHSNTAFLAFPLLYAVFGDDGLFYGTIYYMIDNLLLTTVGVKRLTKDSKTKVKLAPVTIALFIALPIMIISNIINFDFSSTLIYDTFNDLGSMTTPLAFLFIGMIVGGSKVKTLFLNKPAVILISIKLILLPLLAIVFFKLVPLGLESMIIIIIMIELLMPTFTSLLALTHEYKQDVDLAASLVVMGHIISIITIPIIFSLVIFLFT